MIRIGRYVAGLTYRVIGGFASRWVPVSLMAAAPSTRVRLAVERPPQASASWMNDGEVKNTLPASSGSVMPLTSSQAVPGDLEASPVSCVPRDQVRLE